MASTIIGLFKGKPKTVAPAAAATPAKGPIVTPLGGADAMQTAMRRRLVGGAPAASVGGLSTKLGG